jgi:hypothetical protein
MRHAIVCLITGGLLLAVLPAAAVAQSASDSVLGASTARLQLGSLPAPLAPLDPLGPTLNAPGQRFLTSAEFERKLGAAVGIVSIGVLREAASVTGPQQSGASRVHPPQHQLYCRHARLCADAAQCGHCHGVGRPHRGLGAPDSLLAQVSSVRTLAYSLSWARREWLSSGDSLALTLSVPARVRGGTLAGSGNVALTGAGSAAVWRPCSICVPQLPNMMWNYATPCDQTAWAVKGG